MYKQYYPGRDEPYGVFPKGRPPPFRGARILSNNTYLYCKNSFYKRNIFKMSLVCL